MACPHYADIQLSTVTSRGVTADGWNVDIGGPFFAALSLAYVGVNTYCFPVLRRSVIAYSTSRLRPLIGPAPPAHEPQYRDLGHNRRSLIRDAFRDQRRVLVKRNTNPSEHGFCGEKADHGDADRPIPRQRDSAGHPAQTHRLPGAGQPIEPRATPTPTTPGPTTWNPRSTPPDSAESRTSTTHTRPANRSATAPAPTESSRPSPTSSTQSKHAVATQLSNEPCSARLACPSGSAPSTTAPWTKPTRSAPPAWTTPSSPKATKDHSKTDADPTAASTASSAPNTYPSGRHQRRTLLTLINTPTLPTCRKDVLQRELGEVDAVLRGQSATEDPAVTPHSPDAATKPQPDPHSV